MGRMYSAVFEGVSVSAAQDLFEITAPSTATVVIHSVSITQDASETSEQLPATIKRVPSPTSGSGGASVTPRKLGGPGDAAAASTVERNNTTRATSGGTIETLRRRAENVLNGWHWLFTPEERIVVPPSGMVVVGLEQAPAAALTVSGELVFEELG
jgi:hypothetical protein